MHRLTSDQIKAAEDGYSIFFEAFIRKDSRRYIEFSNFVHKHYGNPDRLGNPALFEYVDDEPVAMQWFLGMPILAGGEELLIAHGADFASTAKGSGFPVLRIIMRSKGFLAEQGVPFRIGSPNDRGFAVASRFGYDLIGNFQQYELKLSDKGPSAQGEHCVSRAACEDAEVSVSPTCPFTASDYETMNAPEPLIKPKRSPEYFQWRVDALENRDFSYCAAHDANGKLLGYIIVETTQFCEKIVDWGLYCTGKEVGVLDKLLAPFSSKSNCMRVSHLNPLQGETDYFKACGFSQQFDSLGEPLLDKLCIMPCSDKGIDPFYLDFANWRLREIDRDHFLNCYISAF